MSLSGNERNNLYLSQQGRRFADVSGLSGIDHPADGRALGLLDYDHDGWLDLAVVNANTPLLQLFRNQIGELDPTRKSGVLALRFVGGNRSAKPRPGFAPRDGYGARVEIQIGDTTLVRAHRAGEGFAAQNSATLLVGLGPVEQVERVRVHWPSGRVQEILNVAAGSLLTVHEDPTESPDASGFTRTAYLSGRGASNLAGTPSTLPSHRLDPAVASANGSASRLRLVTTMATWCDTCKGELPQVARLRAAFSEQDLALVAVPVDEDDDRPALERYEREQRPAYELLKDLRAEQIEAVKQAVMNELWMDLLPAVLVTDADGTILAALSEMPSVSQVKALLADRG